MTTIETEKQTYVEADMRGRVTIPGMGGRGFFRTSQPDGSILLTPARPVSEVELRYLKSARMRAAVQEADERVGEKVTPTPRRPRQTT